MIESPSFKVTNTYFRMLICCVLNVVNIWYRLLMQLVCFSGSFSFRSVFRLYRSLSHRVTFARMAKITGVKQKE